MEIVPTGTNIVILASNYNPSIVSQDWLRAKGIISQELVNFVHLPVLSLSEARDFVLTIDEDRLTLALKNITDVNLSMLKEMAIKYIDNLPETPYKSVGLNYRFQTVRNQKSYIELTKEIFISESGKNKVKKALNVKQYNAGVVIFCDKDSFKIKIDVEPILKTGKDIGISFNYHTDIDKNVGVEDRVSKLKDTIDRYDYLYKDAYKIAKALLGA